MYFRNELVETAPLGCRQQQPVYVARDPLLSAGDLQQLTVERGLPDPVEAACAKRQVEGLPVHLLRIGERAVNIEYQRLALHLRTTCEPRAIVSFLHSIKRQIIGVKINCSARSILPPGQTIVLARDMNESCNIDNK